jgi:hypothetical protein
MCPSGNNSQDAGHETLIPPDSTAKGKGVLAMGILDYEEMLIRGNSSSAGPPSKLLLSSELQHATIDLNCATAEACRSGARIAEKAADKREQNFVHATCGVKLQRFLQVETGLALNNGGSREEC